MLSLPSIYVHEECSERSLHRLHKYLLLDGHRAVGSFHGVEVEQGRDDLIRNGLAGTNENGKAIQGSIYENSIARFTALGPYPAGLRY